MAVSFFHDLRTVQQVECTGHFLTPASDLFSLTLYSVRDNTIIAYANLRSSRCSTSSLYSACFLDPLNSRGARLVTLVHDLERDETRMYGCNVSSFQFGRVMLRSWRITVRSQGEYCSARAAPAGVWDGWRYNGVGGSLPIVQETVTTVCSCLGMTCLSGWSCAAARGV